MYTGSMSMEGGPMPRVASARTESVPPPPPPEQVPAARPALQERSIQRYEGVDEEPRRRAEQVMLRNNVFLIHTIQEDARLRHNENSNVSAHATFEDDLDTILAFEPSLSASSIQPGADAEGRVSGLWSQGGGVLLSGGDITFASEQDNGTRTKGIRERTGGGVYQDPVSADIDAVVSAQRRSRAEEVGGYNELVIANPEVSGYFKRGEMDEQGTMWAYGVETKQDLEELHRLYDANASGYTDARSLFDRNLSRYQERFDLIKQKGLPFYTMTPDRRFFEVVAVNPNGSLAVGPELTPEQSAEAPAGLPRAERKKLGQRVLEKGIFRDSKTQDEAKKITEEL